MGERVGGGIYQKPAKFLQAQMPMACWHPPECTCLAQTRCNSRESAWQTFSLQSSNLGVSFSCCFLLFAVFFSFYWVFRQRFWVVLSPTRALTYFLVTWMLSAMLQLTETFDSTSQTHSVGYSKGPNWAVCLKCRFWVPCFYILGITFPPRPGKLSLVCGWHPCFTSSAPSSVGLMGLKSHTLQLLAGFPPHHYPAFHVCVSTDSDSYSPSRVLYDPWLIASSFDDWLSTSVLITMASFAIESSGNGTCCSPYNSRQQDKERHKILLWLAYLCLKSLFLTEDRKAGNRRKNEVLAAEFEALLADWKLDSHCTIQCNNK